MGLAASQGRFLQLTARKSNIEFVGQQINQQRLSLANESAGLFEESLSISAPTPPSSMESSFFTPAYAFSDKETGLTKKVLFGYDTDTDTITGSAIIYDLEMPDGTTSATTEIFLGDSTSPQAGSTTGMPLEIGSNTYTANVSATSLSIDAVDFDKSSGRLKSFSYGTTGDLYEYESGDIIYSAEFDDAAFDEAMSAYEYSKAIYDQEIERINIDTAKIQQQDKSLELKLKQLDTEHTAIQTEIDAVQKVIQKNIEGSFKTFSS